jgi:hypothetical protein
MDNTYPYDKAKTDFPNTSANIDNCIALAFVSAWMNSIDVDVYRQAMQNTHYHPFVCHMYDLWQSALLGN